MLDRWNPWLRSHRLLTGAGLAGATFALFAGTLGNGFVYDDGLQILENSFVQNPHLWRRIFASSVWSFQGAATNFYRPLQFVGYWIVYRLAGPNPGAFHLLNLLIYVATAWLVYRIGCEFLGNESAALAGALLWAVHPEHVEAVAWISALPDLGFAFFALLAFLLFLRAEKAASLRREWPAALAFVVSLFFKEMALAFPLLILAYWLFFAGDGSWWRRALRWSPFLAAAVAYILIRYRALGFFSQSGPVWHLNWRVVGAAVGLLGDHTRIFFWPVKLSVFRMFDLASSLRSPWPWLTLAVVFGTLAIRQLEPRLAFLIAWWPVALLPVLDIRQLSFPQLADRFAYFPSVGLCLALSYLLLGWLPRRRPAVRLEAAALPGLAIVLILFALGTLRAIPRWRDNDTLYSYSSRVSPNTPLIHVRRALVLEYEQGNLDGAASEYRAAMRLNQQSFWPVPIARDCYLGLGRIALREGRRAEAIADFNQALAIDPSSSDAYDALGALYFPSGHYATAAAYFEKAVRANPQDLGGRFYLGTCDLKLGKFRDAAAQFHAARLVDPNYRQAYVAEAKALEAAGDPAAAALALKAMPK